MDAEDTLHSDAYEMHLGPYLPLKVSGPGGSRSDDGGAVLGLEQPDGFWARLTSRLGSAYSWEEVIPDTGGTWADPLGQRTGTTSVNPAYEASGNITVGVGVIVWLTPGAWGGNTVGQEYVFVYCCEGQPDPAVDPPTVSTECCDGMAQTLYATFTNVSGCACLDAVVVELNWDGEVWQGSEEVCTGRTLQIVIRCNGADCTGLEFFLLNCGDEELTIAITPGCTCPPLVLSGTIDFVDNDCCTAGGSVTVDITE